MFPTDLVTTDIGVLEVWTTSDGHVGMANRPGETVTVNRVEYTVRFDISKRAAGEEPKYSDRILMGTPGETDYWYFTYDALLMRRADTYSLPSAAAREKALKALTKAMARFLTSGDGRAMLNAGGAKRAEMDVERLTREIAELDAKRAEAVAKLAALGVTV